MTTNNIFEVLPDDSFETADTCSWHLLSYDGRLSLRLIDALEIGETLDGELSFIATESSRPSARIELSVDGPWLVTRGGPQPVRVNGFRVRNACRLYAGDEIAIEDLHLRVAQDLSQSRHDDQLALFPMDPFDGTAVEEPNADIFDEFTMLRGSVPPARVTTTRSALVEARPSSKEVGRRRFPLGLLIGALVIGGWYVWQSGWVGERIRAVLALEPAAATDFASTATATQRMFLPGATTDGDDVETAMALQPVSTPTYARGLEQHLTNARKLFADGYVTGPNDFNAVAETLRALAIDAGNAGALAMLEQCADRLVTAAGEAREHGLDDQADALISELSFFDPQRAGIVMAAD